MILDKQEHRDFLIEVIHSIRFAGTLSEIKETIKISQEVLKAIKNAKVQEIE